MERFVSHFCVLNEREWFHTALPEAKRRLSLDFVTLLFDLARKIIAI